MVMNKRRIFIAIEVPEEVKNVAEAYLNPFFKEGCVRIPDKEGWHITVVFCGYLDETEIKVLQGVVDKAVSQNRPFKFFPLKIVFAPADRSRMVWLSFKRSAEFEKLKALIGGEIIAKQDKPLLPHLTLARFEERHFPCLKKFLPEEGIDLSLEVRPFEVASVNIMESHLDSDGAEYELVKIFNFKI